LFPYVCGLIDSVSRRREGKELLELDLMVIPVAFFITM
jgi:hypothetical protein